LRDGDSALPCVGLSLPDSHQSLTRFVV
jgi:hypothetical protein